MRVISAHERNRGLTGKLALVLLCLVALELVLIGHQVQTVKALKKKIYLKKLKKILPFLALVKPKKKLILVPIPIPMYNKQLYAAPNYQVQAQHHMHTMNGEGSSPPMSFMMVDTSLGPSPASPTAGSGFASALPLPESAPMSSMMMPSMTMTIQSDGSGTLSAIELNASSRPAAAPSLASSASSLWPSNNSVSGALLAGQPGKWSGQQHQQQLQLQQYDYDLDEQFLAGGGNLIDELPPTPQQAASGGEHYYSSPWQSSRPPLASPAKYLRKERLRQQEQHQPQRQRGLVTAPTAIKPRQQRIQKTVTVDRTSGRLINQRQQQQQHQGAGKHQPKQRFSAPMPVLFVKNQWQPSASVVQQQQQQQLESGAKSVRQNERTQQERHLEEEERNMPQLTREQEQQISQALEQESLVQVGPAQMLPIYQSPSGRLSMSPPAPVSPLSPRVNPTSSSGTTLVSSVATGDTSSSSFDDPETSAPPRPDSNAEVQTIGSSSGSSFFHLAAVGDTPTATEYSTHVDAASSPRERAPDGQHTAASEPTTMPSSRGLSESATATTDATVGLMGSGRLASAAAKGGRGQSPSQPQPQPQPPVDGTKASKASVLDAGGYQ